jgi:mRNA interferase RelE/StbE
MATCLVEWKPSALRELKRLDREAIPAIVQAVGELVNDPLPPGACKLHGSDHTFRIRIGHYRVIYEYLKSRSAVVVSRIGHRKDVCR